MILIGMVVWMVSPQWCDPDAGARGCNKNKAADVVVTKEVDSLAQRRLYPRFDKAEVASHAWGRNASIGSALSALNKSAIPRTRTPIRDAAASMVDVDDLAKITQDGAKPPWENNAEFLGDMTLRLSDGTEFSVNKHVMCVFSSVIRAAPSLDEPFPIPHPSRDAVETLLCLCYERVMLPKDYKFEYGIFKTVANVWDLATFLNCSRILHDLRKEIDRAIHDISRKDYAVLIRAERTQVYTNGYPRYDVLQSQENINEALKVKAEYDLAFTALHAMEAVPSGSSIKWSTFELTIIYRCVNFGLQGAELENKSSQKPFSYSKDHAKRLSASTKDQLLERMSGFCPTDPWQKAGAG
jgi:hypothetical protein